MKKVLNAQDAYDLLKVEVESKGREFVYVREVSGECKYVHGTAMEEIDYKEYEEVQVGDLVPGCLVGHVLVSMGVPMESFLRLDINQETDAEGALRELEESGLIGAYNRDFMQVMSVAQGAQDGGRTWGEALDEAKSALGLLGR